MPKFRHIVTVCSINLRILLNDKVNIYRKEVEIVDYTIADIKNKLYIRLNSDGKPITCNLSQAQRFSQEKANNILNNLPRRLKTYGFKLKEIHDVIENVDYVPDKNITRWIDNFGKCADTVDVAKMRIKEISELLEQIDKELIDVLHIIEIERSKDMFSGWKLYKRIKENRLRRRSLKDEKLILQNAVKNVRNIADLSGDRIKSMVEGLSTRKYTYRVIDDDIIQ